jgi:hypothetical protein
MVALKLFAVVVSTLLVVLGVALLGLIRLNKAVDQSDPGA